MKAMLLLVAAVAGVAVSQPATAQEQPSPRADGQQSSDRPASNWHLFVSSGFTYYTRDLEDQPRTDYYRVPLIARLSNGRLRISASMPYLIIHGPGGNVGDDETDSAGLETRKGFGDLNLQARYRIPSDALGGFDLDLIGRVKLGTASHRKRLGTGETDYIVGAELSRDLGSVEPFVSGTYRFNGDRPDQDYRNTVSTSIGSDFVLGDGLRASLSYDYTQSRFHRPGFHSLEGDLSKRLRDGLTLTGTAAVGLSERAPDFRVGALLSARVF